MDIFNSFLSVVMHIAIGLFLLFYVPLSLVYRLVFYMFVRPFLREDLKGKIVLITGASSGIGEQLAYSYAKRGACLVLAARREVALKSVAKTAREYGSPDVLVVPADISNCDESQRLIEETITRFGQINHLVLNAGITSICLFEDITNLSAFRQVLDVNYWGAVYPTYYAIPYLKKSRGKIIVTASMAGRVPTARRALYNASKAAIIRFYETLRAELGSEVRITILVLGNIASEMTQGPFPVGCTDKCAEVVVDSACKGDTYVTWPSWYGAFHMLMCAAPEIVNWLSRSLYVSTSSKKILSKKITDVNYMAKKF